MKKIFSLIIALTLLVSVFALSAVAFADESEGEGGTTTTPRTITVNNAKLMEKVGNAIYFYDDDTTLFVDGKFVGWLTTTEDVKAVFEGINFATSADGDDFNTSETYDTVRLEYCTGNTKFDENWEDEVTNLEVDKGGTSFELTLSGRVAFRYSVSYKATSDATEETKVCTDIFVLYIVDRKAPVVEMGTTLTDKVAIGLTVGSAYTVSTSSSSIKVTDLSTTTTTYVINKRINGAYVQVYSSVDGLSEDYEGTDISSGTITPTADDVLTEATYQIIYTVTDAYGYVSAPLVAEFKVNAKASDVEEQAKVDVLKIVLYIIAGLSAAGIVVLLVIKPKQQAPARVVYTETPASDDTNTQDEE